ncbi:MAG: hypothetical protein JWL96_3609 [Sphingomonas bacterium]|uniref:hypothetical protein n=1 Tax=Sphingomonas bacterium TaxID=1895847 RepID=UPI0026348F89|nr:hypothetical protein [Sphingomonas bacterium]MDB5711539.1 hypothetical protein [Sphingomonas bacterium]
MKYCAFLLAFAALPAIAAAQDRPVAPAPAAPVSPPRDVVVTGVRLKDTEAALKACIARKCPPKEDIDATMAHAENEFVAGDYHGARQTLLGSVGRNRRYAKQYPIDVSDLMRANSRVAVHLGEGDDYLFSANEVVRILKSGLAPDDYRVLGARVELADAYAKSRDVDLALNTYRDVASRAHKLGLPGVEGYTRLREVGLLGALSEANVSGYGDMLRRAIDSLVADRNPQLAAYAFGARPIRARIDARHGNASAIDQMIAEYRRTAPVSTRTILLYSPPIVQNPASAARQAASGETLNQMAMDDFDNQWVDISFWVAPDGHVTDAGVLRQSSKLNDYWVKPIVTSLSGRRYAPLAMDPSQPGVLRVERYTFTSRWTNNVTGSHMRQREPTPQVEMVDLTVDPPSGTQTAPSK